MDIHIEFVQDINPNRTRAIWYGGDVCHIHHHRTVYIIAAVGHVDATIKSHTKHKRWCVKIDDRHHQGEFAYVSNRLPTDKQLIESINGTHPTYTTNIYKENWWEIHIKTPKGTTTNPENIYHGSLTPVIKKVLDTINKGDVSHD